MRYHEICMKLCIILSYNATSLKIHPSLVSPRSILCPAGPAPPPGLVPWLGWFPWIPHLGEKRNADWWHTFANVVRLYADLYSVYIMFIYYVYVLCLYFMIHLCLQLFTYGSCLFIDLHRPFFAAILHPFKPVGTLQDTKVHDRPECDRRATVQASPVGSRETIRYCQLCLLLPCYYP